jgi:TRAP-type transport system small permease protein
MERLAAFLEKKLFKPSYSIAKVGMFSVVLLMFLTAGDSILRTFFNRPITGAHELTEFVMTMVVFLSLAYTTAMKGHISIDLLVSHLPAKARAVSDIITSFLSLGINVLITWQCFVYALEMWRSNDTSSTINVPIYPFVFVAAIGFGLMSLILLVNFFNALSQRGEK